MPAFCWPCFGRMTNRAGSVGTLGVDANCLGLVPGSFYNYRVICVFLLFRLPGDAGDGLIAVFLLLLEGLALRRSVVSLLFPKK